MDRVYKAGAAGSPPSATENTSSGYFTGGNPGTGTPATTPGPYWFHMVTEEILAVLSAASVTPDKTNTGQLAAAISALITSGSADVSELYTALTIASNAITVNLAAARTFKISFNANITTTTLSNVPTLASNKLAFFNIKLTANGSAFTWAWLTSTVIWPGGVAPTFTTTNGKRDWFFVWSDDGGTTWFGRIIGQNY